MMKITFKAPLRQASLSLAASLLLTGSFAFAQQTITYTDGENNGTAIGYGVDSNSVAARFASSPGVGGFKVEGASVSRDSLVGGLGLGAELQEGLIVQLGYYGEHSSDFESHSLLGSVNLKF